MSNRQWPPKLNTTLPPPKPLSLCYAMQTRRGLCTAIPSLLTLFHALDTRLSPSVCTAIHANVVKSRYMNEGFVGDRLVSAYVRLGLDENAFKLFDEIPHRDVVSWNSLIAAFSRKEKLNECLSLFSRMRRSHLDVQTNENTVLSVLSACIRTGDLNLGASIHGFAIKTSNLNDTQVSNSLTHMYGKFGAVNAACLLFDSISSRNLVSWNSILNTLAANGDSTKVISLFNLMRTEGVEPDQASVVSLLQGCTDFGIAKPVEVVHTYIIKHGFTWDVLSMSLLVSSYSKSGRLSSSQLVFKEITHPDRIAWTIMIASYTIHGDARTAIEIFNEMIKSGINPDHVTFVHLLNACSHSGLVNEGKKFFNDLTHIYKINPTLEHYSCMVDLLGRSGLLTEADETIKTMKMEPNAAIWGTLLGACRIHKNLELGKKAAYNLISLSPSDRRNYIMLCNLYSACGHFEEASEVRSLMKQRGPNLMTCAGYSVIEHANRVYRFVVGDRAHPDSDKIYEKLDEVMEKIKEGGFVCKKEFVVHDVDDDVKEEMISKHSEKLAIAFGLMVTERGTTLTVIKNLRICGDCHEMAKFVSRVEGRTIVIRDPKRFHHFSDGVCSCGDYW